MSVGAVALAFDQNGLGVVEQAQSGVVLAPVRHAMAHLREVVSAVGVLLVGHGGWARGLNLGETILHARRQHPCTNALLRQYLPKGTDLSVYSQDELDTIADSLNNRPRATHGFNTPLTVFAAMLARLDQPHSAIH